MKKFLEKYITTSTLSYTIFSGLNKILAAILQIFAIFVFTRIFNQFEVTILFLLFGFNFWFQMFQFGFPQTLQNKFNANEITKSDFFSFSLMHLLIVIVIGLIFYKLSIFNFLISSNEKLSSSKLINAFSLGSFILIISSNNILLHRLLLVLNKGLIINFIQLIQTSISFVGLLFSFYFKWNDISLVIFVYFLPLITINLIALFFIKYSNNLKFKIDLVKIKLSFIKQITSFFFINVVSSLFIGMDYFYAVRLLDSSQINSYHIYTRIFFLSFVFYYSFIQFSSKNISKLDFKNNKNQIKNIIVSSIYIGCLFVSLVYLIVIVFDYLKIIVWFTNGISINSEVLFFSFLYYFIRVFRDVFLVIMNCINHIRNILFCNLLETILIVILFKTFVPLYGIRGIFFSFIITSFAGLIYIFFIYRKIKYEKK